MHEKFVSLLACPETRQELVLESASRGADGCIESGILRTRDGSRKYPVRDGIPRFCDDATYADSFAFEWKAFGRTQLESTNRNKRTAHSTRDSFLAQTGFSETDLKGKTVVEFGCGPGRYLEIARSLGAVVVGLELTSAVDVAKANLGEAPDVLLVQGSALQPPFKPEVFDCGFTIGVLHHTPVPAQGARELIRTVKPGGAVAVSVYPEGGFYSFPSVYWTRKAVNLIESRVSKPLARRLALGYAYLSAFLFYPVFRLVEKIPIIGTPFVGLWAYFFAVIIVAPGWRWRVLDTFDAITPSYASTHTPEEVAFWLREFGCCDIRSTGVTFGYSGARPANFVGRKSGA